MTERHDIYSQMDRLAETRRKLCVERDNARVVLRNVEYRLDQVEREAAIVWRKLVTRGEKGSGND